MMSRLAFPVMALLVSVGCSGREATAPADGQGVRSSAPIGVAASEATDEASSPRSGTLHMEKECSMYTGRAGSFCTLTASNLKQLPAGTRIVYTDGLVGTTLETDVTLYPPTGGSSVAFGHVSLDLVRSYGIGTLTGGTGRFKHLQGQFEITPIAGVRSWQWAGTYSFAGGDDD